MKCINQKILEKMNCIETNLVDISVLIKIIHDSCLVNDYTDQEISLKLVLNKLYNVIEDISCMS